MAAPSRPSRPSPATRLAGTVRTAAARYRLVRVAAAAGLALLAGTLVDRAQSDADRTVAAWGPSQPVLVATRDLAPGDVVAPDDVRLVSVPAAFVPADAVTELVPRTRAHQSLAVGEILRAARLTPGAGSATAARIPPAMLAITLDAGDTPAQVGDAVALYDLVDGSALEDRAIVVDRDEHTVTVAAAAAAIRRIVVALGVGGVVVALTGAGG